MTGSDPLTTQRDLTPGIAAELAAAGLEDAQEIGRGGFGVVYRCAQPDLERTVAVKVLTADLDEANLERFLREQHAMGRLSGHPNIVSVFQAGVTESGRPYIVMQYDPRGSLEARIRRGGPLGWQEALHLGVKLAGALETAHRMGMLHRDVKPANILLTEYGEPQLTDFGIARIAGGFETATGTITVSPAFTAPEVLQGRAATTASDVYSLGATLFCTMTGHAAFERRSGEQVLAQFRRIITEPVPDLRPDHIPDALCAAIERAMAHEPADRPGSAAEFGEELRGIQKRQGLNLDELPVPLGPEADRGEQPPPASVTGTSRRSASREYARRAATPPAPATRFRPPTPTRQPVARTRLIEMLDGVQRRRLTVIHAPTGFGKSTLAAQWRDVLTAAGVPVAWLTVDRDDNNVVWFLAHLIEAIRQVRPALARELRTALDEHGDEAEQYVLTSLINEVHAAGERVVVVIDDWHRVRDPATTAALAFLLDHGCHHLQVIVTSRSRAGLPLSRLRVRDELVEIDAGALRFDADETHRLLVEVGGLDLGDEDVENLRAGTEGWVAALQLASLSLRGREDPGYLIERLSGRHRAIGEFLAENVLATLEPDMLDFLLATAIPERICGSLASVLTGRGQALLEEVERRDLFLSRLDDEGQWFRYHHLFAEFLRQRLERDQPERVRHLHRVASEWFADHTLVSEAVDHALAAGDDERAVDLVERDGYSLLEHAQMTTFLGLEAKLPQPLVVSRPRLLLATAWANIQLHRPDPARRALDRLESILERSGLTPDAIADARVEEAVVRGIIELRADRPVDAAALVALCRSRCDTLRPWVMSAGINVATFDALYRFDFAETRRLQDLAAVYHDRNIGPSNVMHGHCLLGLAALEELEVAAAEQSLRAALRVARQAGGSHSHSARLAGSILGELLYERGDIAEAERLLDEGSKLDAGGGVIDFKIARYVVGARVKALRGDRGAAATLLHEGARTAETMGLARLRAHVENERLRLGLPAPPDLGLPVVVEHGAHRRPTHGTEAITAQVEADTAIRMLLAEPTPPRVDLACRWAREWVDHLHGSGRARALLHARRLLVACLSAAQRHDEAKTVAASIAAQCAVIGLGRCLPDGGPHVISVVAALREDQLTGRWRSEWPAVPVGFLTDAAQAQVPHTM